MDPALHARRRRDHGYGRPAGSCLAGSTGIRHPGCRGHWRCNCPPARWPDRHRRWLSRLRGDGAVTSTKQATHGRPADVLADVWDSLAAAAAVESAARLGVLARLDISAVDAATLARECCLSERGAQMLLAALAGIGLVEAG